MKKLFTLLVLCVLCLNMSAQSSTNKIVLSIAPNATEVQFAVKLDGATSYSVNFGIGEGVQTFNKAATEDFIKVHYTFTHPRSSAREITLDATNIVTFRVTASKAINGIKEVVSDKIKELGFANTNLDAYPSLDISQCPALINAVFVGSNLESVKLPAGKTLESIQVSASWVGTKKSLKEINLSDAEGLKSILITDAILTEVDLSKQTDLETLCIYNPNKIGLRKIIGAKSLMKITRLNLNGNNLGFDQIPNRVIDEAPLEQFQYAQSYYYVDKSKINNNTIDLSHLLKTKGISTSEQNSSFTWLWKAKKEDKESVYSVEALAKKIRLWQDRGEVVVFTNGCFDILHRGHLTYLKEAATLGDHLVVALNSDSSVRRLKGDSRPINHELDRALLMSSLGFVDGVVLFEEDTPAEVLSQLRPNILVKGGDYKPEDVIGKEFVEEVQILPFQDGYSTTGIIKHIQELVKEGKL